MTSVRLVSPKGLSEMRLEEGPVGLSVLCSRSIQGSHWAEKLIQEEFRFQGLEGLLEDAISTTRDALIRLLGSFPATQDEDWQLASRARLSFRRKSSALILGPGEYSLSLCVNGPTTFVFEMVVGGSSVVEVDGE